MSQEIKVLNKQREELLEVMGYCIGRDCTIAGLWVWTSVDNLFNPSFDTQELALDAAWNNLTGQIKAAEDIDDNEWELLSFEQQKQIITDFEYGF